MHMLWAHISLCLSLFQYAMQFNCESCVRISINRCTMNHSKAHTTTSVITLSHTHENHLQSLNGVEFGEFCPLNFSQHFEVNIFWHRIFFLHYNTTVHLYEMNNTLEHSNDGGDQWRGWTGVVFRFGQKSKHNTGFCLSYQHWIELSVSYYWFRDWFSLHVLFAGNSWFR